jgi:hypothetical protein
MKMNARRVLLLAGSLWEIVRFFLLISLLAFVLRSLGGVGGWVLPWLLLGGSGNLLVAAGGIMLSLYPDRNGGLIMLLRVGKILAIFSYLLLVLSGAMRMAARIQVFAVGGLVFTQGVLLLAIFLLDLLFLAVLLAWRTPQAPGEHPAPEAPAELSDYTESEARNFH